MLTPLFTANRAPSPCAVCHSPLMLYTADFGKRVLPVWHPLWDAGRSDRNILITASCALLLNKRGLNWSQSSSLSGGTEPSCFTPSAVSGAELSAGLWLRAVLTLQIRHYSIILLRDRKSFLVYWFLSFSYDTFSSEEATPNSFPSIYRNLKFVPLIQNSQEFS